MRSRNGVYYDLSKSTYRETVDGVTFHFSSRIHQKKFAERLHRNRAEINKSLSNRFKLQVEMNGLADLILYNKVETRGFHITTEEWSEECRSNVQFNGGKVTKSDSKGS